MARWRGMGGRGNKSKPEPEVASPIAFHACSNGEYSPRPRRARDVRAERRVLEIVEAKHKRLGVARRACAESACGIAAALLVINEVYGCSDGDARSGGGSGGKSGGGASGSGAGAAGRGGSAG